MWIGEDRSPDLAYEYEAILRGLYPEEFVDALLANDEAAAVFLGGRIEHEKSGDLVIRYVVGPEKVGIMGLLSHSGRLRVGDAAALKSWLKRVREQLDLGKEVYVSLNDKSEPLFMRVLQGGNFKTKTISSHEFPFGIWKTVRVVQELDEENPIVLRGFSDGGDGFGFEPSKTGMVRKPALKEQELFTDSTGKFWGNSGAGGLFYAEDTKRYLIAKRSAYVNEPNTWGTWGGKLDEDETPEEALEREIVEETGYSGPYELEYIYTFKDGDFQFDNYLIIVPHEFEPDHSWETSGHKWVSFGEWPNPLHFGMKALIPHLRA